MDATKLFISSEAGQEILIRVAYWLAKPGDTTSLKSAMLEDLKLIQSRPLRDFITYLLGEGAYRQYQPLTGTLCAGIESRDLIRQVMASTRCSTERRCFHLRTIRNYVTALHGYFLTKTSCEGKEHFRLRDYTEVNWTAVTSFFRHADAFYLRTPGITNLILELEVDGITSMPTPGRRYGENVMLFLCNYATELRGNDDPVEEAFRSLVEKDAAYVSTWLKGSDENIDHWDGDEPTQLVHRRLVVYGSPANFYRAQIDTAGVVASDYIAERSNVFRFLRQEFRKGKYYLPDVLDDFGQNSYCHVIGAT